MAQGDIHPQGIIGSVYEFLAGKYAQVVHLVTPDGDEVYDDTSNALQVTQVTKQAGEDLTNDVMKVEGQFTASYQATTGDNKVIKASAGYLKAVVIGTWVTGGVIEISDHASDGDGALRFLLTGDSTASVDHGYPKYIPIDCVFSTGISADITAFTGVTFIYR